MRILILNVGSSSVKYEVFEHEKSILKGRIERIKNKEGYSRAIRDIITELEKKKLSIDALGHRVVHGGTLERPARITKSTLKRIEKVKELAPLHNIPEILAIKICMKLFRQPQFAVFDTAFHQTLPEKARTYALPAKIAKEHSIQRYGFHGTSHEYVAIEACRKLKKRFSRQRIITCHLGNGCSVTAIKNGKSIDTSMGFTPLEGLVMGTRSGDMDPAILTYLAGKGYSAESLDNLLNQKSGLLGISGESRDMRDLLNSKSRRAKLAVDVFVYRLVKYIGAYHAALGGTDILVFTGGIGENSARIRNRILSQINHLGIKKDIVIKTDEARMMARKIRKLL